MYTSTTDTSSSVIKKPETMIFTNTAELKNEVKNLKNLALISLQNNCKSQAIQFLKFLRMGNIAKVDQDIPDTDRYIADLILQYEIPEALEALLKSIRSVNHLAVISGKKGDYSALKQFIERSLWLNHQEYQTHSETKRNILKQLIKINPELIKIIKAEINQRVNSSHPFKNDFELACNECCQNPLPFMTCQSKENSDSRIMPPPPLS